MGLSGGIFREEALDHQGKPERLDHLLRVTAPHEWVILLALALLSLAVVAWVLLGSVERAFSASCHLALTGERYAVVSHVAGSVAQVLAQQGDPVEAGQPIARVRLHELDREVGVARARVALLETRIVEDDKELLTVLSTARAELLDLETRRESAGYLVSPHSGEITVQNLVADQEVTPGFESAVVRTSRAREFEAIALVSKADAEQLKVGMPSQVVRRSAGFGAPEVLEAEVAHISDRLTLLDGRFASSGSEASASGGHLLRLALREPAPTKVSDGESCTLRVVLSSDAPVRLLGLPFSLRQDV